MESLFKGILNLHEILAQTVINKFGFNGKYPSNTHVCTAYMNKTFIYIITFVTNIGS